jgi:hypothetical protein
LDVDSSAARSGRAAVDVRQWVSLHPAEDFAGELTALAEGAESEVAWHFRRNRGVPLVAFRTRRGPPERLILVSVLIIVAVLVSGLFYFQMT